MSKKESLMLGLRTTIYMVDNVTRATEWYSKAFGTKPYYDTPYYVGFNIKGYELGLHPKDKYETVKTDNVLSYWGVDDIRQAYNHLIDLGATKHEEPNNVGGEIMVASVYDPWMNIIGIIFNPEFKIPK